jgi:predicted nucleotidyltransferase
VQPAGFGARNQVTTACHNCWPERRIRHHEHMELRPGLQLDEAALADFAARHGVRRLALYGSALRDDFNADSDIDILVEFHPGRTPGLFHLAQMELELEAAIGRTVELRTYEDLSPHFRDQVAATARALYAA